MNLQTLTDKGRLRAENQDNYWSAIAEVDGVEYGIVCICDGMGGLKNGGDASRIVAKSVKDYIVENFDFDGLQDVLIEVNKRVNSIGGSSKETMMGTTCSILMVSDGVYRVLHVGDSRVYLLRGGKSYRITEDHSAVVALHIDRQKEPEKWLKYRSKLTRCIGAKESVIPDYYEGKYIPGDIFFLCSDGVWHTFDNNPLVEGDLEDLHILFDRCMFEGESDNLTACVLRI